MSQTPNNPYQSANPYQQPMENPQGGGGGKPGAVMAPAIALIVVGTLDVLYALFNVIANAMGVDVYSAVQQKQLQDAGMEWVIENANLLGLVFGLIGVVCSAIVILGGINMLRLRGYGIAVVGAIIAIIPCTGILSCCLVGQGIGIWAIVILMMADYKRLFQ